VHKIITKNVKLVWVSIFVLSTLAFSCVDEDEGVFITLPLDETDPNNITIAPVKYPIYQNGDFLEYQVSGSVTAAGEFIPNDNATGSLKISWQEATLFDPFIIGTTSIIALKETTTLDVNGLGNFTSVRYIRQDAAGAITLLAVEKTVANVQKYFWIFELDNIQNLTSTSLGQLIFKSPISPLLNSAQITYYVLAGCNTNGTCDEVSTMVTNNTQYSTDTLGKGVQTILGTFETVRIAINSKQLLSKSFAQSGDNYIPFYMMDMHAACGDQSSATKSIFGHFDVHPSVGIVTMFVSCDGLGSTFSLYFDLSTVSANLEKSIANY